MLIAARSGLGQPADLPPLSATASDPPGFELDGSRVYLSDPKAYLQDLRADAAGRAALTEGLSLLPGDDPPVYRELLYAGGTLALRELLLAWAALQDTVVWDNIDRPHRLPDYLAKL